jgi:hypothetical protein
VARQSRSNLYSRRIQHGDRAAPPARPVPLVPRQQAGTAPPFVARA